MKCSMCGMSFGEDQARSSCQGCACSGGCGLVKCPHCGFEAPRSSAWGGRIAKLCQLFRHHGEELKADGESRPLDRVTPSSTGWQVQRLGTTDETTVRRLLLIGAVPGAELVLEQAFPAYVIRIGHSRFALDRSLAAEIYVTVAAR